MGVPLSTPTKAGSAPSNYAMQAPPSGKTVFEDKYDTIAPVDGSKLGEDDVRWKFDGPWLAGLDEGQFNKYLVKEVRKRKDEFRNFLRKSCAIETTAAQRRVASERGEEIPAALQACDITNDQLTDYIRDLRKDQTTLYKHIRSFLDLPPPPTQAASNDLFEGTLGGEPMSFSLQKAFAKEVPSESPYAETGPPKTHPSAGLAYSRSSSYLFNHPIYGPQKNHPPVPARVVMPRAAATGSFSPVLGVGGFGTNVPMGSDPSFNRGSTSGKGGLRVQPQIPGLLAVEPEKEGGSKAWVPPRHARIDPKGRVILNVVMADPEAVAVHEGTVGDIPTEHRRPLQTRMPAPNPAADFSGFSGGYGLNPRELSPREEKKTARKDNDALKELAGLVGERKE